MGIVRSVRYVYVCLNKQNNRTKMKREEEEAEEKETHGGLDAKGRRLCRESRSGSRVSRISAIARCSHRSLRSSEAISARSATRRTSEATANRRAPTRRAAHRRFRRKRGLPAWGDGENASFYRRRSSPFRTQSAATEAAARVAARRSS